MCVLWISSSPSFSPPKEDEDDDNNDEDDEIKSLMEDLLPIKSCTKMQPTSKMSLFFSSSLFLSRQTLCLSQQTERKRKQTEEKTI